MNGKVGGWVNTFLHGKMRLNALSTRKHYKDKIPRYHSLCNVNRENGSPQSVASVVLQPHGILIVQAASALGIPFLGLSRNGFFAQSRSTWYKATPLLCPCCEEWTLLLQNPHVVSLRTYIIFNILAFGLHGQTRDLFGTAHSSKAYLHFCCWDDVNTCGLK